MCSSGGGSSLPPHPGSVTFSGDPAKPSSSRRKRAREAGVKRRSAKELNSTILTSGISQGTAATLGA